MHEFHTAARVTDVPPDQPTKPLVGRELFEETVRRSNRRKQSEVQAEEKVRTQGPKTNAENVRIGMYEESVRRKCAKQKFPLNKEGEGE